MNNETQDPEVSAMSSIANALFNLDNEARSRVIEWATKKFGVSVSALKVTSKDQSHQGHITQSESVKDLDNSLADLIEYSEEDGFIFHFRDVKAKSALDAVNKLVHISVYAYEKLTGNKEIPRAIITKVLEDWRVNDGNARNYISKHAGIKKKGNGSSAVLFLDRPGKLEAESFLSDLSNSDIGGTWNPTKKTVRKKVGKKDEAN